MSDIKCPFCQQELLLSSFRDGDKDNEIWNCLHCQIGGKRKLWQELIRIRKALDVAVDKLKGIKAFYDDSYADPNFVNWHIVAQRLANDADDAIKAITAQE